ncbi:MAG: hypothetical protein ACPL7J_07680, partial [Desulfomonilaceae bacterium]
SICISADNAAQRIEGYGDEPEPAGEQDHEQRAEAQGSFVAGVFSAIAAVHHFHGSLSDDDPPGGRVAPSVWPRIVK